MARRHFATRSRPWNRRRSCLLRLREEIDRLFAADAELADWGRRMAEEQLRTRSIRRLRMARQERAVQARTARISPIIAARIALKDLAAYLFVTPQSLSRIRAEIK